MKKLTRITALLFAALLAGSSFTACSAKTVEITDEALEEVIRKAIKKPEGDILPSDMEKITELDLEGLDIVDISALSYATKLKKLNLSDNNISDISALKELSNLTDVWLFDNNIKDFSPVNDVDRVFVNSKNKKAVKGALCHSLLADPEALFEKTVYDGNETADEKGNVSEGIFTAEEEAYISGILDGIKEYTNIDSDIIVISDLEGYEKTADFTKDYVSKSGKAAGKADGRFVIVTGPEGNWKLTANGGTDILFTDEEIDAINVSMKEDAEIGTSPFYIVKGFLTKAQIALDKHLDNTQNASDIITTDDESLEEILRTAADKPYGLLVAADYDGITELDLSGMELEDISEFKALGALTSLDLSDNKITDITVLGTLAKLTSLDLSNNEITDITVLGTLTQLTKLNLSGNEITDISPLKNLKAEVELDLTGITPTDGKWDAVAHIENVTGRPEPEPVKPEDPKPVEPTPAVPSGISPSGTPYTPEGNYHSVIKSIKAATKPTVDQVNDTADFLNGFEETVVKGYLKTVPSKYQISFVTISKLEGYDRYDDYRSGQFNADYRKYNGFAQKKNWGHLTYCTSNNEWVLSANGELLNILKNDKEVAKNFTVDFDKGIVIGSGYEKLVELLIKWIGSI